MITVQNLTKIYRSPVKSGSFLTDIFNRRYKETHALRDVSFTIHEGELVGFIGPNGAGKTTTLKILSGILYPTSGKVSVLGYTPFDKKHDFLRRISFIMGNRNQLLWDLPVIDSFTLYKEVYQIPDSIYLQTRNELGSLLSCTHLFEKPVKSLSLGERMKVELIAGLLHRPEVILFDEPTIGLDIFSQEAIRSFIKAYQKEYKPTIIFTSHYLEDVKRLAHRIIIINRGTIVYDGTLRKIITDYSRIKKINISLEHEVAHEVARRIGVPKIHAPTYLIYHVQKSDIPEIMRKITETLPFSDITVEDETIEEVIKSFFLTSQPHTKGV